MKEVLLLCLLAFMSCEKDIIDLGKCIYKAPKVQEFINDVIVAIVNQDFTKLLTNIKEALPDLINTVLGCLTDAKAIEDETKLKELIFQILGGCNEKGLARCKSDCCGNTICYKICVMKCGGLNWIHPIDLNITYPFNTTISY